MVSLKYPSHNDSDQGDQDDHLATAEKTEAPKHQPREVVHDLSRPFEAPAQTFVEGPYYASVEEVMADVAATDSRVAGEYADPLEEVPSEVSRRDFLKLFSVTALAGASSCVPRPVEKIVPYHDQPMDTVPGVSKSYATTCGECSAGCGVEVKTKDGRPVKLEGRQKHFVNKGSLCAVGQASIQGLYHPERPKKPKMRTTGRWLEISYDDAYERLAKKITQKIATQIATQINEAKTEPQKGSSKAGKVGILTGELSASQRSFYELFLTKIGSSKSQLYSLETKNLNASMAKAHEMAWGLSGIPRLSLEKARLVVGISSDFLTTGVSPLYQSKGFGEGITYRQYKDSSGKIQGTKGKFVQFESSLTITGAKADKRYSIPVGSELAVLLHLLEKIVNLEPKAANADDLIIAKKVLLSQKKAMDSYLPYIKDSQQQGLAQLASELINTPSCVLAGGVETAATNGTQIQLVALLCNKLLGAYDNQILSFDEGWHPYESSGDPWQRFQQDASDLDVLFVIEADPIRSLPKSWGAKKLLSEIPTVVSIQNMSSPVDYVSEFQLPCHHYLESWGDAEPMAGALSLRQPAVRPLYGTKQAEDMLMWIAAHNGTSLGFENYRAFLESRWIKRFKSLLPNLNNKLFVQYILRMGVMGKELEKRTLPTSLKDINQSIALAPKKTLPKGQLCLLAPFDYRLGDGRFSHLPILQEIGDGLTTVTWDNVAAINPHTCRSLGIKRNDVIRVKGVGGKSSEIKNDIEVAVFPMPGLARDAIVIHQGGGINDPRNTIAHGVGVNPLDVVSMQTDSLTGQAVTCGQSVEISSTSKVYRLAAMQKHNDIANRMDVFRRVGLDELETKIKKRKASGKVKDLDDVPDLYPSLDRPEIYMHKQDNKEKPSSFKAGSMPPRTIDYRWSMSVDLDKCTGCGACMVACSLENNVPQVGRAQINLGREMFWIRLDRYFDGDVDEPGVSFQPVMCQQCNHAPCEAVCPVFATTHDPEGINAMTYNRCVGTRYCANACPYKVRRFNWWTHKFGEIGSRSQDRTPRALNPDVTVRTRGVMEKCNFCYGRIAEAKQQAKQYAESHGMNARVGKISTACEQTCPVSAITFGNLKEPASRVSMLRRDERAYLMLGGDPDHGHYGIKTLPNVFYLAEVVSDTKQNKEHKKENKHKKSHSSVDH